MITRGTNKIRKPTHLVETLWIMGWTTHRISQPSTVCLLYVGMFWDDRLLKSLILPQSIPQFLLRHAATWFWESSKSSISIELPTIDQPFWVTSMQEINPMSSSHKYHKARLLEVSYLLLNLSLYCEIINYHHSYWWKQHIYNLIIAATCLVYVMMMANRLQLLFLIVPQLYGHS